MRDFEPMMMEQVDIYIQQLIVLSRGSKPVNMSDRCKYFGIDVIGYLAFGYDLKGGQTMVTGMTALFFYLEVSLVVAKTL
ncbi:hypothetical protein F5B22DRAFT_630221 [Xylaria bambusicola]|uniref:uncharacterized protein n=1 Tax=Xylaria bambusicola TaxID=326684 RepID=UPI002007A9AD|nr:uncharacterized protein F5B22DRAFT_630221 [Xylaria bambusicola]KAI0503176.1 hypothetical protein F5B22DRAFT_630221 [Xylaria bambusicola]